MPKLQIALSSWSVGIAEPERKRGWPLIANETHRCEINYIAELQTVFPCIILNTDHTKTTFPHLKELYRFNSELVLHFPVANKIKQNYNFVCCFVWV